MDFVYGKDEFGGRRFSQVSRAEVRKAVLVVTTHPVKEVEERIDQNYDADGSLADLGHREFGVGPSEALAVCELIRISL